MTATEPDAAAADDRLDVDADVVIPTVGRLSLTTLLRTLAAAGPPWPRTVLVVDDRRGPALDPLPVGPRLADHAPHPDPALAPGPGGTDAWPAIGGHHGPGGVPVVVLRSDGRGPAAARNVGWRAATATWVAFLDDDVEVPHGWGRALAHDLAGLAEPVAAGEPPEPYLEAMARSVTAGGMLPEQVWDTYPVPERRLYPGRPTGSAAPLVWAHAELLKLYLAAGHGVQADRLEAVAARYRQPPVATVAHLREAGPEITTDAPALAKPLATARPMAGTWDVDSEPMMRAMCMSPEI